MKNIEYHFDVNSVIGIKFVKESYTSFVWVEEKIKKRFLGKPKIYPAGFIDTSSYRGNIYTEGELLELGYKVYGFDERVNNLVCRKPYVVIYFGHKLTSDLSFESDEMATEWIEGLKNKSGKTFEVIK
jgi:hypothetical protein